MCARPCKLAAAMASFCQPQACKAWAQTRRRLLMAIEFGARAAVAGAAVGCCVSAARHRAQRRRRLLKTIGYGARAATAGVAVGFCVSAGHRAPCTSNLRAMPAPVQVMLMQRVLDG